MDFADQFKAAWKDAFAVGDTLIDAQHKSFFDEVNAVATALDQGAGREAVVDFYRAFYSGLMAHFRDEEALLLRIGYPDLEGHHAEHEALLASVSAVEGMLLTGDELHQWRFVVKRLFIALVEHLVGTDMRYKSYVQRARRS